MSKLGQGLQKAGSTPEPGEQGAEGTAQEPPERCEPRQVRGIRAEISPCGCAPHPSCWGPSKACAKIGKSQVMAKEEEPGLL